MPPPALQAFQEKLASETELQEKFVNALERFTRAVVDSGKANGHSFETSDVFRFIKGTYLSGAADNVLVSLFAEAAGQSSATSQLSTLNIGQNPKMLEALQKASPAADRTPAKADAALSDVPETGPVERESVEYGTDNAAAKDPVRRPAARAEPAAPEASDSDAGGDAQPELLTAPPAVGPSDGREDTAVPRPVESPSNPWEQSSASGGAKAWDQNPASSESAWNQDKKPWWKFW
jgi:hypothetical protein